MKFGDADSIACTPNITFIVIGLMPILFMMYILLLIFISASVCRSCVLHVDAQKISIQCRIPHLLAPDKDTSLDGSKTASEDVNLPQKVIVRAKAEYHSEMSREMITDSELAQWWLSMYLQQANILLVRLLTVIKSR